ncbi:hypothetical protein NG726_27585 [Pseudomonas sp. MOB-449]|nr:hypothetical protein [Pseudomonas sp. MOB-449]
MDKPKSRNKKVGLGQGLKPLLSDEQASPRSDARKAPHPDWVPVPDAISKLSQLIQAFYQQRYPGCAVSFGIEHTENINFCCDQSLDVYFRVQARGAGWPEDTLVIACVRNLSGMESRNKMLELLNFLIIARKDVGYFNLGFENPGKLEAPLIKKFGFEELEGSEGRWTISIAALKDCICAGSKYR